MDAILNACYWNNIGAFQFIFYNGPIDNKLTGIGLTPGRQETTVWTNGEPVYGHIYASAGLNELKHQCNEDA